MEKGIITVFRNVVAVDEPFYVRVDVVVDRIRDGNSKKIIEVVRSKETKKEKDIVKQNLPSILFSGAFKRRANNAIIQHSGYVAIDFDNVDIEKVKGELIKDKYVCVCFVSPGGKGIKAVVKIPPNIKEHPFRCMAITKHFENYKIDVDEFKDVARICYESYDPDVYYNPDSKVFMGIEEPPKNKPMSVTSGDIITDVVKVVDILDKYYNKKGYYYADGNKHQYAVAIAAGVNRGGLPEVACANELIRRYTNKASYVEPEDFRKIASDIYRTQASCSGSSYFNTIEERNVSTGRVAEPEFKPVNIEDFVTVDNVRDDMLKLFRDGLDKGETTYFEELDEHYRMKRGELTLFHGITNHGKSTFVMQLCLLKSINDGYRWAFFSPEQNPPSDFFNDLIHMYVGKTTLPGNYQMSMEEYEGAMDFVSRHFILLNPKDDSPTPDFLMRMFAVAVDTHKADGCIIDPYNQMINDIVKNAGGREDQYLSSFLSKYKWFAQKRNIFMFIITHPKGDIRKDKEGNYEIPDIYNLAGGAMWSNKCDNVVCVYRPYWNAQRDNPSVWIESQKIKKQKLCGRPGKAVMGFNWKTCRYNEVAKKSPFDKGEVVEDEVVVNADLWYEKDNEKEAPF